jgi:hypothetical protein
MKDVTPIFHELLTIIKIYHWKAMVPSAGPKKRYVIQTHGRTTAPSPPLSRYLKNTSRTTLETTDQGAHRKS